MENEGSAGVREVSSCDRGTQASAFEPGGPLARDLELLINADRRGAGVVLKLRIRPQASRDFACATGLDTLGLCLQGRIGEQELVANLVPGEARRLGEGCLAERDGKQCG